MEKMKFETDDLSQKNVEKIGKLFPNCITETKDENGKLKKAIDFEMLKQMLSDDVIDEGDEAYEFTWVGKKASMVEANKPIRKTLRPCKEESKDWDNTENLYIEGDNLEVLKLLQESYLNKIKMIYIDPPYNTGNNLIYKNNFYDTEDNYLDKSGALDEFGNKLIVNTKSNGRFHSDWCSMIYSRLLLSRNLLTSDGIIAIAIDDNELYTLKQIADEVYGESNYIGTIVTRSNPQGRNKNNIDPVHEYHLIYAKDILEMPLLKIKKQKEEVKYGNLMRSGTNSRKEERPNRFYPMLEKNGKISVITEDEYSGIYSKENGFDEDFIENIKAKYENLGFNVIFPVAKNGELKVWQRTYDRVKTECTSYKYISGQIKTPGEEYRTPVSLWSEDRYSNVSNGTNNLKKIFESKKIPFDFSKSIYTVRDLISLNTEKDDIVLDFFSGSATTAHAVMDLNAEDGKHRKFILVQLPEKTEEGTVAYSEGYKTICEVGEERIRLAGSKINESLDKAIDVGFRILKLDYSNMKDVYYTPDEYSQRNLFDLESNIKEDRTELDLLYGCLIDWGIPLNKSYESTDIDGSMVHIYNDGDLIACFDEDITEEAIKKIAKMEPLRAVFRDSSFKTSSEKINVEEIFKLLSPETSVRVL